MFEAVAVPHPEGGYELKIRVPHENYLAGLRDYGKFVERSKRWRGGWQKMAKAITAAINSVAPKPVKENWKK